MSATKKIQAAQHTPGPWVVRGPAGPTADAPEGGDCAIVAQGNAVIAETFFRWGAAHNATADAISNAHLIAAAPDLLTALKRVRAEISEAELNYSSLVPAIDSAVAKAEGRS